MGKGRWGVISTAKIGVEKVIPAMQRCESAEVVAIASRDAQKAASAARRLGIDRHYGSYEELLARGFDLEGSTTDDLIEGSTVTDRINGGAGADILIAGRGDDELDGGTGDDLLDGGIGNDVYRFGVGGDRVRPAERPRAYHLGRSRALW